RTTRCAPKQLRRGSRVARAQNARALECVESHSGKAAPGRRGIPFLLPENRERCQPLAVWGKAPCCPLLIRIFGLQDQNPAAETRQAQGLQSPAWCANR